MKELITTDVAQWKSSSDLIEWCERIRSQQLITRGTAVAFIDEIDCKLNGSTIYGQLLAPLWDRKYTIGADTRELGRVVFLMAGSTKAWTTSKGLINAAKDTENNPKLLDLVSRLSRLPIEIPDYSERYTDRLLLTVSSIRRKFPSAREIERRLLCLLLHSELSHGARSIQIGISKMDLSLNEKNQVILPKDGFIKAEMNLALQLHFPKIHCFRDKYETCPENTFTRISGI